MSKSCGGLVACPSVLARKAARTVARQRAEPTLLARAAGAVLVVDIGAAKRAGPLTHPRPALPKPRGPRPARATTAPANRTVGPAHAACDLKTVSQQVTPAAPPPAATLYRRRNQGAGLRPAAVPHDKRQAVAGFEPLPRRDALVAYDQELLVSPSVDA